MVSVAITGIGGLIGRRLATHLSRHEDIDRIVGIDIAPPTSLDLPGLVHRHADIRDAGLARAFEGVDTVFHLAFMMNPIQDEARMRSVNVDGTRNVFEAAAEAGVRQVVYLSSAVVYGAHPDNDFPLTEDSPLRANPDLSYARHKAEIERWLWPWVDDHPDLTVSVLRPTIVAGEGADNFFVRLVEAPVFLLVAGHRPPLQFVHVEDLVSAMDLLRGHDEAQGAFNVGAEGWLSMDEVSGILGRPVRTVPEEVGWALLDRMWQLGVGDVPPGTINWLMHPFVVSPRKLIDLGWRPMHSNRDCFAELVADHSDRYSVGKLRVPRKAVTTAAAGAGAAVAVGGVVALTRAIRRWRASADGSAGPT